MGYANAEIMRIRRRHLLQSLAAAPAAALPAAAPAQTTPPEAVPKLATVSPEAAADGVPRFFTESQFNVLRQLADVLVPAYQGRPSASRAGAPEFLDFLVSQSPAPVQQLYREGLDRLIRDGISATTLAPLTEPWTYDPPADPFARFLQQAKIDLLQATFNSREWAESTPRSRRSASATGYLWRNLD